MSALPTTVSRPFLLESDLPGLTLRHRGKVRDVFDVPIYKDVGGVSDSLSRHAEAIYRNLNPADRQAAEALFKSITQQDIQEAVETAGGIGDDTIQQQSGTRVNPDR